MSTVGFVLIDKAPGWTSHDVVAKVRKQVGGKVGHAGTLDPMATGLLVIALGRATRLLRFVQGRPKEYLASAVLGVATDSLDADGAVLNREPLPVSEEEVRAAMRRFEGRILQVPPMVSARKIGGKRLYSLAREGKEVEREPRPVDIHHLELVDFAPGAYPEMTFVVRCGTGTYVRTLADDIARSLGGRAHLTSLRRTRNGSLSVESATSVEEFVAAAEEGTGGEFIIPPATVLGDLAEATVDSNLVQAVRNGAPVPVAILETELPDETYVRMLDSAGDLLGIYRVAGRTAKPEVVLA
jgi:tRNA pseudouridine55 synthase